MGEALVYRMNDELRQLHDTETGGFIYRATEPLRSVNIKGYEPDIVSIGPYHYGKEKYEMMQKHKLRYLKSILKRSGETIERYVSVVAELEEEARNCYAEHVILNSDDFIKMLLLDGCFIIEFAIKFHNLGSGPSNDPILKAELFRGSLARDLILFENQIPFFILCKLFDLIEPGPEPDQYNRLIDLLLSFFKFFLADQNYRMTTTKNRSLSDVKHLLDLVYRSWTPESFDGAIYPNEGYPNPVKNKSMLIPPVLDLIGAGIKFKERKDSNSLFDIKFENGTLFIPPLIISDEMEGFLRNLLTYEYYFQHEGMNCVGAYLSFMDGLINSSKDVEVLAKHGIIHNWVGDHEVIASMFNRLMDSVIGFDDHFYRHMLMDINSYYSYPWNRLMANLRTPLGFISFSSVFLNMLTVIQTVCAILQVMGKGR